MNHSDGHMRSSPALIAIQIHPLPLFRFLDLPGEIRNRIYELLLCTFVSHDVYAPDAEHEDDVVSIKLRPSMCNSQLLRVCRQIHDEAVYIKQEKSTFVRLVINEWLHENSALYRGLQALPKMLIHSPEHTHSYHYVLTHEMWRISRYLHMSPPKCFLILPEDMGKWINALDFELWVQLSTAFSRLAD